MGYGKCQWSDPATGRQNNETYDLEAAYLSQLCPEDDELQLLQDQQELKESN